MIYIIKNRDLKELGRIVANADAVEKYLQFRSRIGSAYKTFDPDVQELEVILPTRSALTFNPPLTVPINDHDSFGRADGPVGSTETMAKAWTPVHDTWKIASGILQRDVHSGGFDGNMSALCNDYPGLANFELSCTVASPNTNNIGGGVAWRVQDAQNGWVAYTYYLAATYLLVVKFVAGVATYIQSGLNVPIGTRKLKVAINGNNGEVFYDGVSKKTWTDAQFASATKTGICSFQNAVVPANNVIDDWDLKSV